MVVPSAHAGAAINAGVEHPAYAIDGFEIPGAVRDSLVSDLDETALH